jgi:hypothetical protein
MIKGISPFRSNVRSSILRVNNKETMAGGITKWPYVSCCPSDSRH